MNSNKGQDNKLNISVWFAGIVGSIFAAFSEGWFRFFVVFILTLILMAVGIHVKRHWSKS